MEAGAEGADRARGLEGLKGRPIGELCAEHEISQGQYYRITSGAISSWPTRRKRSSRPAPHNARAGSNARTRSSRSWSAGRRAHPGAQKNGKSWDEEGPYAQVTARNAQQLLERITALKSGHPFWGYRRLWAHLRYVVGLVVNPKRVYGVMKASNLLVRPNPKLRARQARHQEAVADPAQRVVGIEMTKVMIEGFGWIYLVVVLDWHSKMVGHHAGLQARAWYWLVAVNRAVNRQFPDGVQGHGLNLMADNGCQPTSLAFMRACAAMGIRQAFTSYSNPTTGNADTERFLRTLKENLVCGCTSGPVRPPSSKPSTAGSPTTTSATSIRYLLA